MEKVPRLLRSPFHSSGRIHCPANPIPLPHRRTPVPLKRTKRGKPRPRIPYRSASEPILWTVRMFVSDNEEFVGINEDLMFPRHYTCTDVFSPLMCPRSTSTTTRDSIEEAKVVVSVVVERSPGPVRAMVRLGASVEEVIEVIIKKYCREGRSPRLSRDGTASFELHYSHFSLQSNRGVVGSERKGTGRSVSWSLLFERRAERLEEGLRFVLYRDGRPAGSGKEKRVRRGYGWGGRANDARE